MAKATIHEEAALRMSPSSLALPTAPHQMRPLFRCPDKCSYIPCTVSKVLYLRRADWFNICSQAILCIYLSLISRFQLLQAYVATGSCQNISNCKFLHDPRICDETLIEEPRGEALNDNNPVGSLKVGFLEWPEVVYNSTSGDGEETDDGEQPTNPNYDSTYELSWVTNATKEAYISHCVYRIWYGLVEYIMEKNGLDKHKAVHGQAAHALGQLPVLQELKTRLTHPQVSDIISTGGCTHKVLDKVVMQTLPESTP